MRAAALMVPFLLTLSAQAAGPSLVNPPVFTPAPALAAPAAGRAVVFAPPLPARADGWYALGQAATRAGQHDRAAQAYLQAAALHPTAANWRAAGDALVKVGEYAAATRAFGQAAAQYRSRGDDVTARALEHRTAAYRQDLRVMLVTTRTPPGQPARLAKFEPAAGVLLGLHVADDDVTGTPPTLGTVARDYAVAFRYWKFTASTDPARVFPGRFAQAVRANGGALHLAVEPGMPLAALSDGMLRRFAAAARASGVPVFLRFASEMNDPQNAWGRDPALYRRTFQRVAAVMRAEAPNVAMVWMPMPGDLGRIAAYYPGAGSVDWAGLSLYSVPFENGDAAAPRLDAHPLETIRAFYERYAPAHPIQLSEYAASHRSGVNVKREFGAFAAQQLREVYWGAWLTLPRLKNINWLDLNMLNGEHNGKGLNRRNDYRLGAVPVKQAAFAAVKTQNAFYARWADAFTARPVGVPVAWPAQVYAAQPASGALWVQAARPVGRVSVRLDGQAVPVKATLPHRFTLDASRLTPGTHRLEVQVAGVDGAPLLSDTRTFEALSPR